MFQMIEIIRLIAACAGLAAIFAPVLATLRQARRSKGRSDGQSAGMRSWLVVVFMTILFITAGGLLWKPAFSGFPPGWGLVLVLAGALFYFPGVCIYLWGLTTLWGQFGVSSAYGAGLYQDHELVKSGLFAIIRHPMYAGVMLTAVGALLLFQTWAMVVFMPLSFTVIIRARREEMLLEQEFGEEWKIYAERVPKWLPRL